MAFEQVIPASGQQLVAEATAANPLVLDGVKAWTSNAYSMTELVNHPSWFTDGTITWDREGTIASNSRINSIARIVGSFPPNGNVEEVYLICVFAHCLHGSTGSVPLCWIYDEDNPLTLPDNVVTSDIAFNINVREGAVIQTIVQGSAFITIPEWERIVTTHKAGQPYAGDNQYIYGNKTFMTAINVNNYIGFTDNNTIIKADYYGGNTEGVILAQSETLEHDSRLFSVVCGDSGVDDFSVWYNATLDRIETRTNYLRCGAGKTEIQLCADLVPGTQGLASGRIDIGSMTNPMSSVSASTVNITRVKPLDQTTGEILIDNSSWVADIRPYDTSHSTSIGTSSCPFTNAHVDKIRTTEIRPKATVVGVTNDYFKFGRVSTGEPMLVPSTSDTGFIGDASSPFHFGYYNHLYCDHLHVSGNTFEYGTKFPSEATTSTISIPVGGIVQTIGTLADYGKSSTVTSLNYGDTLTISADSLRIAKTTAGSSDIGTGSFFVPAGTYIVLSECSFSGGSTKGILLLQRKS